jgi:hypothetical protein
MRMMMARASQAVTNRLSLIFDFSMFFDFFARGTGSRCWATECRPYRWLLTQHSSLQGGAVSCRPAAMRMMMARASQAATNRLSLILSRSSKGGPAFPPKLGFDRKVALPKRPLGNSEYQFWNNS